jgi:hypothetical protein
VGELAAEQGRGTRPQVTIVRDPLARYLSHILHWLEFDHADIYKEAMQVGQA